jgi:hypothetical protein
MRNTNKPPRSNRNQLRPPPTSEEFDPTVAVFLTLIDRDMIAHPENLRAMDEGRSQRIAALVEGAVVDMDEDLGDEQIL